MATDTGMDRCMWCSGGDALLVLNLGLDVVDRIGRLHVQRDGLSSESLHKNLFEKSEQG
jgi:hypothetical protein